MTDTLTESSAQGRTGRPRVLHRPGRRLGAGFIWLWVAFNIFLIGWIGVASLKPSREIFSRDGALALPTELRWENYVNAWQASRFDIATLNTVVVVLTASAVVVALAAPAAYVLSRSVVRSAGAMTTFFAIGMGIPLQAVLVPLFLMTNWLGLADSLFGLGIVYVAISLPFTVFLLTGFFRSLPSELEEAAALDGASGIRTFVGVMLPLAQPGIVTALTLNVVLLWNETLLALVLITDNSQYTLPRALLSLYGTMQYTGNWGGLFAGSIIVAAPVLLIFAILSRRIIEGMTLGASK
jgi:N-acetylglucosamine transport system permease protein